MKQWICSVCGHVHEGIAPPELCPVCKVTSSHFRSMEEVAAAAENPEKVFPDDVSPEALKAAVEGTVSSPERLAKMWICLVCGHVHEGIAPPELCPVCKATSSHFRTPEEVITTVKKYEKVFPDDVSPEALKAAVEGTESSPERPVKLWVCLVCGNVHQGVAPPELCPICKATSSHFRTPEEALATVRKYEKTFPDDVQPEALKAAVEGTGSSPERPVKKWVCSVCGYVHEGIAPPELCPVCKVPASKFSAL